MKAFFTRLSNSLGGIYENEWITLLTLFISFVIVANPHTSIFTSGRNYVLISHFITEVQFGGIILFFLLLSIISLIHRGLRFRKNVLLFISIFWVIQFSLFVESYKAGYLTWLMPIFAIIASSAAARIAAKINSTI